MEYLIRLKVKDHGAFGSLVVCFLLCGRAVKTFRRVAPCLHRLVRWPEPIDFKYESNQRYPKRNDGVQNAKAAPGSRD